jgi:hypothetical protein
LVRYFRLTAEDVEWVNRTGRGVPNKLGLAIQLCVLPWLGFVPDEVKAAPRAAVARIAIQLGVEAGALRFYASRDQTRTDHLKLVATRLGWQVAEDDQRAGWKVLREFLVDRAIERDVPSVLFRLAVEHLSSDEVRIIRPGVWPLMDEISSARREADHQINRLVQPLLIGQRVADLDGVVEVEPEMPISRAGSSGCIAVAPVTRPHRSGLRSTSWCSCVAWTSTPWTCR